MKVMRCWATQKRSAQFVIGIETSTNTRSFVFVAAFFTLLPTQFAAQACPNVPSLPRHAGYKEYVGKIHRTLRNDALYKSSKRKKDIERCYYEKVIKKACISNDQEKMFFLFAAYYYFYYNISINTDSKLIYRFYKEYFSCFVFSIRYWDVFFKGKFEYVRKWVTKTIILQDCSTPYLDTYFKTKKKPCTHLNNITKNQYNEILHLYFSTMFCKKQATNSFFELYLFNVVHFFLSMNNIPHSWKSDFFRECAKRCENRKGYVKIERCFR